MCCMPDQITYGNHCLDVILISTIITCIHMAKSHHIKFRLFLQPSPFPYPHYTTSVHQCVCVCVCVCVRAHADVHACVHACMCVYVCVSKIMIIV